jgi:SAM-dependent methyltransferase
MEKKNYRGIIMKSLADRYLSGDYLANNPSWDAEDSDWKAAKIENLLARHGIVPQSVGEVGCGAGGILAELRGYWGPDCRLVGYDIAPALRDFWRKHGQKQILFILGDFLSSETNDYYDVLLMIDVIEHLENPFDFLRRILRRANWFILHIPLDLHAQGAIRNSGLLRAHHQTGHLHFWNKDLVLSLLQECGLEVIRYEYTAGAVELNTALFWRKIARWPRRLFFYLAPDWTARILGGYSLLVLAKAKVETF